MIRIQKKIKSVHQNQNRFGIAYEHVYKTFQYQKQSVRN